MEQKAKIKVNLPTKITISRIVVAFLLIVAIVVLYIVDQFNPFIYKFNISLNNNGATINWLMIILFVVFLIASFTDFLDGYLARKNNQVTDLGKFLDPIADKMLINAMMIFLALNFPSLGASLKFPFFCVIIMEIRDLIVDGLRFMAATKHTVIAANIFGKLKTVLQMVAISFVFINGWPFSYFDSNWLTYLHITDFICYAATFVSVLSGAIYLIQNKAVFLGQNNDSK
jgi:CDP-diacylglycerol---glycerol-3-phosphate 3-phosphatidyltransferase